MHYTRGMTARVPHPAHIYLLVIGLAVGMILSPWVMGNVSPEIYQRYIAGVGPQVQQLHAMERDHADRLQRLMNTGVTPDAVDELQTRLNREFQAQSQVLVETAQQQIVWLRQRGMAIWLAVLVLMAVEALLSDTSRSIVRRLTTGRYALIAVWLAMVLAQPAMLAGVPVLFALLLIAAVVACAVVPLPRKQSPPAAERPSRQQTD